MMPIGFGDVNNPREVIAVPAMMGVRARIAQNVNDVRSGQREREDPHVLSWTLIEKKNHQDSNFAARSGGRSNVLSTLTRVPSFAESRKACIVSRT